MRVLCRVPLQKRACLNFCPDYDSAWFKGSQSKIRDLWSIQRDFKKEAFDLIVKIFFLTVQKKKIVWKTLITDPF